MERADVEQWMDAYVRAWRTNEPEDIGRLFTDDARYFTAPHREPWRSRESIVSGWLDRRDEEGEWDFRYEVQDVAGDTAYVRGWTTYHGDDTPNYSNLWVVRLTEDGRCSEFTEWWMEAGG